MALDEQQQRALAFLARACRPRGSRPWDEVGIAANIAKVADRNLPDVILAVTRAASDPNANTPGVIPKPGPHWSEGSYQPVAEPPRRVDTTDRCSICIRPLDEHHNADHQPRRNVRTPQPAVDLATTIPALRGLIVTDQKAAR